MKTRRLLYVTIGLFLLGATIASLWVSATGGSEVLAGLRQVRASYFGLFLSTMALYIFARFIRWQFLLRRIGVRVPTRPSLAVFIASLAGIATPLYVGEAVVRGVLMKSRFGTLLRVTTWVLVVERLLDIATLGLVGALTAETWLLRGIMLAVVAGAGLGGLVAASIARAASVSTAAVVQFGRPSALVGGLGLSLVAWVPATLLVSLAAASLGLRVPPIAGMNVFTSATLLGGLTLMPAGVGSVGSLTILRLQDLGLSLASSVVVGSLVRLITVGVSLAVGAVFLLVELVTLRQAATAADAAHFDEIAAEYKAQFSEHVWRHLVERKLDLLTAVLPDPSARSGIGLDLGCGLGEHCLAMGQRGYRVIGLDAAQGLVQQARQMGATVTVGDALALPFRDASFDFVYTVGVLHHLPGAVAQARACREAARVLKPGGYFLVHETNPRNPLFRFYMGYVFPLLRTIDEGTESWIGPSDWDGLERMELVDLQYSTFMPDFVPRWLMRPFLAVERWLEASRLRSYSAHYVAVLQRQPASQPVSVPSVPTKPVVRAQVPTALRAR